MQRRIMLLPGKEQWVWLSYWTLTVRPRRQAYAAVPTVGHIRCRAARCSAIALLIFRKLVLGQKFCTVNCWFAHGTIVPRVRTVSPFRWQAAPCGASGIPERTAIGIGPATGDC